VDRAEAEGLTGHAGRAAAASTAPSAARLSPSPYDAIASLYDPWSVSVTEDISFYVAEARKSGGPVVELGVGTGRIAVPTAVSGVDVIGVDSSAGMLEVCRRAAGVAGVEERLDLRLGDLAAPPVDERVRLVTCPFRSYLHLADSAARATALRAARSLLVPGGRLIFDVFSPRDDDIEETHGRWIEREPGIFERADWDAQSRTLTLSVRGADGEATMQLAWISADEWRRELEAAGFEVDRVYGWFDYRPYRRNEDMVFVARNPG
jgi:SAM-dependent methyltransferase